MGVCEQPAAKYASHQNTRRMAAAVALQPTATRLLRLLDNRTTVVIGDSHSLNLWCALTCWLLSEGAELSLGASAAGPALVTRLPPYEARWLLAVAADARDGGVPLPHALRAKPAVALCDALLDALLPLSEAEIRADWLDGQLASDDPVLADVEEGTPGREREYSI